MRLLLIVCSVGLALSVGAANAPAPRRPSRDSTVPITAEMNLEVLERGMKEQPVGQVVRERYRVAGIVRQVLPEGVLLDRAAAIEWKATDLVQDGSLTRRFGPGKPLDLGEKFAFIAGVSARIGQHLSADVNVVGSREFTGIGLHATTKVRVFQSAPARTPGKPTPER